MPHQSRSVAARGVIHRVAFTGLAAAIVLAFGARQPARAQDPAEPKKIVATVSPSAAPGARGTFATLPEALAWSLRLAGRDRASIEIVVEPGEYREQTALLRMNGRNLEILKIHAPNGKAVFDGVSNAGTFIRVVAYEGKPTNVTIEDIVVRRYAVGFSFYAAREDRDKWNGGNRIKGVTFEDIGQRYDGQNPTTAVIALINSRDNVIENNTFTRFYNVKVCGAFHALYIAHHSIRNRITGNKFTGSCGDPVRIRDASDGSILEDNSFSDAGASGLITEWHCDRRDNANCTKSSPECPVVGTRVGSNENATSLPLFKNLGRPDNPDCAPAVDRAH